MTEPSITAIHHLTLNVRDVERSERWYTEVLGLVRFRTFDTPGFHRVLMRDPTAGFTLGLNRHVNSEGDTAFDEGHTAGLDHFALQVPDREALDGWVARFDEHGVIHSEVHPGGAPGSFLVAFRDPDNIQIEVYAPPPAS